MIVAQRLARFPSPLEGEGARAEAKPSEGGRGVLLEHDGYPSPDARSLSLRVRHPLPQGERGRENAARFVRK